MIVTEDNKTLEGREALEYMIKYNLREAQYALINLESTIRQIERRMKELEELKDE